MEKLLQSWTLNEIPIGSIVKLRQVMLDHIWKPYTNWNVVNQTTTTLFGTEVSEELNEIPKKHMLN